MADGDARVGAEQVDGPERALGGGDQRVGMGRVRDVARDADAPDALRDLLGARAVEVGDDDTARALGGEAQRQRAPDP